MYRTRILELFVLVNLFTNVYVNSFISPPSRIISRISSYISPYSSLSMGNEVMTEIEDDVDYGSMLDFNEPVVDAELVKQFTLTNPNTKPVKQLTIQEERKKKRMSDPYWNDYHEEQFGSIMDASHELTEETMWLAEARDVIEMQSGRATWSKCSDQEIQARAKRAAANRKKIPAEVAQFITAVYIDKTHTMSEYRVEDEFAYDEFWKWKYELIEKNKLHETSMLEPMQRMLQRKIPNDYDPVLMAKIQLTNDWLQHNNRMVGRQRTRVGKLSKEELDYMMSMRRKPPSLSVMDEVIVYPHGTIINADIDFEGVTAVATAASKTSFLAPLTQSSSMSFAAVSTWPPPVTASMMNWNKKLRELPSAELAGYPEQYTIAGPRTSPAAAIAHDKAMMRDDAFEFMVDEEEMFVASSLTLDDEYFVVI